MGVCKMDFISFKNEPDIMLFWGKVKAKRN
jgi:hypothetical protein